MSWYIAWLSDCLIVLVFVAQAIPSSEGYAVRRGVRKKALTHWLTLFFFLSGVRGLWPRQSSNIFFSSTDSYHILLHFTDSYRLLPILTVSYRFLPIVTDSGVLLRSMGEEGAAKERQRSSITWEAGGDWELRIENWKLRIECKDTRPSVFSAAPG